MTSHRLPLRTAFRKGFTLIELLVVISIIAVLVAVISPAVQMAARRCCAAHSVSITSATWGWPSKTSRRPPTINFHCLRTARTGGTPWSMTNPGLRLDDGQVVGGAKSSRISISRRWHENSHRRAES